MIVLIAKNDREQGARRQDDQIGRGGVRTHEHSVGALVAFGIKSRHRPQKTVQECRARVQ